MSEYLFAYGTLQPGLAPAGMAATVARLAPLGEGFVRGVLYDLGHYPAAVLDPSADGKIYGTVFRLPDDPEVLRQLDAYEEYEPDCVEASLFVRVKSLVEMEHGDSLACWIYVYGRDVGSAPVIGSGKFKS